MFTYHYRVYITFMPSEGLNTMGPSNIPQLKKIIIYILFVWHFYPSVFSYFEGIGNCKIYYSDINVEDKKVFYVVCKHESKHFPIFFIY